MIVVKTNRNQRLGNLLFNIGMAYTIQGKLPNHPDIYCINNTLTSTEYFQQTLKPIFFNDVKFVNLNDVNLKKLTKVRGGQYELIDVPIKDDLFLTWHFQDYVNLDIDLLRKKYVVSDIEQFCKTHYSEVFDGKKEVIGVHVRRDDYVTFKKGSFFKIYDIDYYKKAIDIIKASGKRIIVTSDDISWCKQNLKDLGDEVYFSDESDMINDMRILMNCDYMVLGSSSTFAVWASYLNTRKKQVVCPKILYNMDKCNCHSDILFPKDYIRI